MSAIDMVLMLVIGAAARVLLPQTSYVDFIASRVEISTPVTSWKRAVEGVHLLELGVSPYEGDMFHEPPLFLALYRIVIRHAAPYLPLIFAAVDLATGFLLFIAVRRQLSQQAASEEPLILKLESLRSKSKSKPESDGDSGDTPSGSNESSRPKLRLSVDHVNQTPYLTFALHCISPLSILPCVAQSTGTITNFLVALTFVSALYGRRLVATALVALLAYHNMYTGTLLVPVMMILNQYINERTLASKAESAESSGKMRPRTIHKSEGNLERSRLASWSWHNAILMLGYFVTAVVALLVSSFLIMGGESRFLSVTYGFLFQVSDLTPNIGLFWYFFTEMFDHFRPFFLFVFQLNSVLYVVPLALAFRNCGSFLFLITLMLSTLLKPYPSLSDLALAAAMFPSLSHLISHMKQGILIGGMFVTTLALAPIMWHIWIVMGTGNANFYFASTLALNTAQIFLITDLLFAQIKRDFFLHNGHKIPDSSFDKQNGSDSKKVAPQTRLELAY